MLTLCREWSQPVFYFVAILGTLGSVWTYLRNSKRERARWIFDLFQHFYEGGEHQKIRTKIESGQTDFADNEDDEELLHKLDNYLNFFEFLDFLHEKRILTKDDILRLFEYPLRQIHKDRHLRKYALKEKHGYEGVKHLFDVLGYPEEDDSQG
jgi:hypothetical protein